MIELESVGKEKEPPKKPVVVIVAGANAVGKGSIIKSLVNDSETNTASIVRHTTRPMGSGEQDGMQYHFVHDNECGLGSETFESYVLDGAMIEYARYLPGYYGTSIMELRKLMRQGINPVLDVDVDAGLAIREYLSSMNIQSIDIYVIPIKLEQLQSPGGHEKYIDEIVKRLKNRKRGFDLEPAEIQDRVEYATRWLDKIDQYGHVVENLDGELDRSVHEVKQLINRSKID
jgi:guanylate kinase